MTEVGKNAQRTHGESQRQAVRTEWNRSDEQGRGHQTTVLQTSQRHLGRQRSQTWGSPQVHVSRPSNFGSLARWTELYEEHATSETQRPAKVPGGREQVKTPVDQDQHVPRSTDQRKGTQEGKWEARGRAHCCPLQGWIRETQVRETRRGWTFKAS